MAYDIAPLRWISSNVISHSLWHSSPFMVTMGYNAAPSEKPNFSAFSMAFSK